MGVGRGGPRESLSTRPSASTAGPPRRSGTRSAADNKKRGKDAHPTRKHAHPHAVARGKGREGQGVVKGTPSDWAGAETGSDAALCHTKLGSVLCYL